MRYAISISTPALLALEDLQKCVFAEKISLHSYHATSKPYGFEDLNLGLRSEVKPRTPRYGFPTSTPTYQGDPLRHIAGEVGLFVQPGDLGSNSIDFLLAPNSERKTARKSNLLQAYA